MGPDDKKYIWQMFVKSPIVSPPLPLAPYGSNLGFPQLVLADTSFVPLARYRRAKVGIVSRARKGFLEILPEGLRVVDMIIVTFVAFMKHRVPSNLGSFDLLPAEESKSNRAQDPSKGFGESPHPASDKLDKGST